MRSTSREMCLNKTFNRKTQHKQQQGKLCVEALNISFLHSPPTQYSCLRREELVMHETAIS
ncbi:CLUMA_CG000630, isoform A [Clunio marinus]|uniref:CLUMA_CG000630, isoform A n=1 Tax=Clunio marinus TaxID=568069 RepID=A0A1J1HFQ0_9DIPT|nr:CLUMA_CG000630, isoform A [Clunio marinus]